MGCFRETTISQISWDFTSQRPFTSFKCFQDSPYENRASLAFLLVPVFGAGELSLLVGAGAGFSALAFRCARRCVAAVGADLRQRQRPLRDRRRPPGRLLRQRPLRDRLIRAHPPRPLALGVGVYTAGAGAGVGAWRRCPWRWCRCSAGWWSDAGFGAMDDALFVESQHIHEKAE